MLRGGTSVLLADSLWGFFYCAGVLHEAASQLGERLSGLAYKQEGPSETPGGHR